MNIPPKLLLFKLLIAYIAITNAYLTKERIMQIAQQIFITIQFDNLNNNDLEIPELFETRKNQIINFFDNNKNNYITAG